MWCAALIFLDPNSWIKSTFLPGMLLVPGTLRVVESLKMPVLFCPYSPPLSSPHLGHRPATLCYLLIECEFKLGRIWGRRTEWGMVELKGGNEQPGSPRSLTFEDFSESHLKMPAYPKRSSHLKPNLPQADRDR